LAELSEVEELLVPPKSTDGSEPRLP